jgi:hypothetical protein
MLPEGQNDVTVEADVTTYLLTNQGQFATVVWTAQFDSSRSKIDEKGPGYSPSYAAGAWYSRRLGAGRDDED